MKAPVRRLPRPEIAAPTTLPDIAFSFRGRISRATFLRALGCVFALYWFGIFILIVLAYFLDKDPFELFGFIWLWVLPLTWIVLGVQVKRFHDIDSSAWWLLINLVPIYGIFVFIFRLGIEPGTVGANKYGASPLDLPENSVAFCKEAAARKSQGDLEGAIRNYDEAIRLNPCLAEAFRNRGNARFENGEVGGAILDYSEALLLDPNDADARYNRALAWERMDDPASAIADFKGYLELGAGVRANDAEEVEGFIRELSKKAPPSSSS